MSFPETVLASMIGAFFSGAVVATILGFFLLGRTETIKQTIETRFAYVAELRTARMTAYPQLWAALEPFALYAPEEDLTYEAAAKVGEDMRHCYFTSVGLLLTDEALDAYFVVQAALGRMREQLPLPSPVLRPRARRLEQDQVDEARKRLGLRQAPGSPAEMDAWVKAMTETLARWKFGIPDDDYILVQSLASSLRTQLVSVLQSRDPSSLVIERQTD